MEDKSLEDDVLRACRRLSVDWNHARHTARLCDRLFREARHLHGLTRTARPLVKVAGLLHDIAASSAKADHHVRAAAIIPSLRMRALGAAAKRIVAESVRLHWRSVGLRSAPARRTAGSDQVEAQIATRIAAILRVADGLDHCRTQGTEILAVSDDGRELQILTSGGPTGVEDAARAAEKADLWNAALIRPIRVSTAPSGEALQSPLLRPEDTLAEAVRRFFQRQIEQLTSREYGLAYDRDAEYVHEARVATRRLRSALRILGKSLGRQSKQWRSELSWLADALGEVRDCDVLLLFLQGWARRADRNHLPFVRSLIRSQRRARRARYRRLLDAFHSERYRAFRTEFYRAARSPVGTPEGLQTAGKRADRPIWGEAPKVLKRAYRQLAKYRRRLELLTPEQQHQLRIDCKRLRYAAEFFAEIYPDNLAIVTDAMVKMQDSLGEAHDADVWRQHVRQLAERSRRGSSGRQASRALNSLLRRLEARKADCLRKAQTAWGALGRVRTRRQIRSAVGSPMRP